MTQIYKRQAVYRLLNLEFHLPEKQAVATADAVWLHVDVRCCNCQKLQSVAATGGFGGKCPSCKQDPYGWSKTVWQLLESRLFQITHAST